jgi:hypothetical protein
MRYVFLLGLALRKSLTLAMQYRWDFVFSGALSLLWTASGLVPFYVAFHDRPPVEGWTYESALVVVAVFTLLRAVLDGAVNPSLLTVVDQIRMGTFDFVLLKPGRCAISRIDHEVRRISGRRCIRGHHVGGAGIRENGARSKCLGHCFGARHAHGGDGGFVFHLDPGDFRGVLGRQSRQFGILVFIDF